jgi:hypothetical protein
MITGRIGGNQKKKKNTQAGRRVFGIYGVTNNIQADLATTISSPPLTILLPWNLSLKKKEKKKKQHCFYLHQSINEKCKGKEMREPLLICSSLFRSPLSDDKI